MTHYYVSGVVDTTSMGNGQSCFHINEEKDGKQVNIAIVPFNRNRRGEYEAARRDAQMIVEALNETR